VQIWNASTGEKILRYGGNTGAVAMLAWSPDGKNIASAHNTVLTPANSTVQIWNAANRMELLRYQGHTGLINAVAWAPDGKYISSASDDDTVQIWASVK